MLLHADADGKQPAFIACIFFRNSIGHWLHAFEAPGWIEIRTLLAGVKFEAAFRTLAQRLGKRGQQVAALSAARNTMRSRHVHGTWPESVLTDRALGRRFPLLTSGVLISMLPVFTVRQRFSSALWRDSPVIVSLAELKHKSQS